LNGVYILINYNKKALNIQGFFIYLRDGEALCDGALEGEALRDGALDGVALDGALLVGV